MAITVPEAVAIGGVSAAVASAVVAIVSLRWSKQASEAKDAQISSLRQQVERLNDLSAEGFHRHLVAMKAIIAELEQALNESNELLRKKASEVSEDKRAIASMLGAGRLLFGINESELLIRRLRALVCDEQGFMIDYGERHLEIASFYVNAIRLLAPSDDATKHLVKGGAAEWVLDYLLMPLLGCMRFRSLHRAIEDVYTDICSGMETTLFKEEVPFYREALQLAKQGHDFSDGWLPAGLRRKLADLNAIQQSEAARQRLEGGIRLAAR